MFCLWRRRAAATERPSYPFETLPDIEDLNVTQSLAKHHEASAGLLFMLSILAAGRCGSIGPATIPRDRFAYSASMNESWKQWKETTSCVITAVNICHVSSPRSS